MTKPVLLAVCLAALMLGCGGPVDATDPAQSASTEAQTDAQRDAAGCYEIYNYCLATSPCANNSSLNCGYWYSVKRCATWNSSTSNYDITYPHVKMYACYKPR